MFPMSALSRLSSPQGLGFFRWSGVLMAAMAVGFGWMALTAPAQAQVAYDLVTEEETIQIPFINQARQADQMVVYTPEYGQTTRTGPYGVEVVATVADEQNHEYTSKSVDNPWKCKPQKRDDDCGNSSIPDNGVVISITGDKRKDLMKALEPGTRFQLKPVWFIESEYPITAINPNAENNKWGAPYPGFRGSNQLTIYDRRYGRPTTETNEFGFEVAVEDGLVTARDGADSPIPDAGWVVSGHGKARDWVTANAPYGAQLSILDGGKKIRSVIDIETYRYRVQQRLEKLGCIEKSMPPSLASLVENGPTAHAHHQLGAAPSKVCGALLDQQNQANLAVAQGNMDEGAARLDALVRQADEALWTEYVAFPQNEIRGVWHRPTEMSPEAIAKTLDGMKAAGVNALFLETFFHGYVIYPSQVYGKYNIAKDRKPEFSKFDHLDTWVKEAHARGIKLHVWVETFYGGARKIDPPGPIIQAHPDWANVQHSAIYANKPTPSTLENGGYYLDPANPEVRTFLKDLMVEMATRYPVDGVNLDYVRYPASLPPHRTKYLETTWGYTNVARELFKKQSGEDPASIDPSQEAYAEDWSAWNFFKKEQVDTLVKETATELRKARPNIVISADIFPDLEESLVKKHQDWSEWAHEGWVDYLIPLTLTGSTNAVKKDVHHVMVMTNGKVPVLASIFAPFNNMPPERLLEQIEAARKFGASGYSMFDSAHITGRMVKALHASQVEEPSR